MIDAARAAQALHAAWTNATPIDALPEGCHVTAFEDAYLVQEATSALMSPIIGWKMAVLPGDHAAYAPLYAERLYESGATLPAARLPGRMAEIELGFQVTEDIRDARPDAATIARSVRFMPTIEILSSRYVDLYKMGMPAFVADGSANAAVTYSGPGGVYDPDVIEVRFEIDGKVTTARPTAAQDPIARLVWLAAQLSAKGRRLEKGQVLATGSVVMPDPVERHVRADWGPLGVVELNFA